MVAVSEGLQHKEYTIFSLQLQEENTSFGKISLFFDHKKKTVCHLFPLNDIFFFLKESSICL